jgi:hypothetical protein
MVVHQGRGVQGTGPRLGVEDPVGQGILGRLPHPGFVLEALQHPVGQGGRHETLPFIRSRVAVPGTDRQPHGGCHAHRDERVPRGIEQRMDHPLPPASEGVCPGPRESEAHQARHDMQCVQMMLETVPDHGEPLVGPNTGVERGPFWVRAFPAAVSPLCAVCLLEEAYAVPSLSGLWRDAHWGRLAKRRTRRTLSANNGQIDYAPRNEAPSGLRDSPCGKQAGASVTIYSARLFSRQRTLSPRRQPTLIPLIGLGHGSRRSAPRALRGIGAVPKSRVGVAGPSAAPGSPPPTQLPNSTGQSPPEARAERDGSGIASLLRERTVHARGQLQAGAWRSRPGLACPLRDARRRRSETFREGGGTHGPDNHFDRATRGSCTRRGRLGLLAVAQVARGAHSPAPTR